MRRVPYRLHELQGREAVYIVEGEKDADRLWASNVPATTAVCGAARGGGKWRDDYSRDLVAAGVKRVAVVPDNDEPGILHAQHVARSCFGAGLQVRILALPDVPAKGDVSDFLDAHSPQELLALARATEPIMSSGEGLIWSVRDKIDKQNPIRDKCRMGRQRLAHPHENECGMRDRAAYRDDGTHHAH